MAATNGCVIGVFSGTSWATAFTNPSSQDILQVVNEGGKVVYSIDSSGVAHTNPTSPTSLALMRYAGSTLAAAFTNPSNLDLIQIYSGTGETLEQRVSYLGVITTS